VTCLRVPVWRFGAEHYRSRITDFPAALCHRLVDWTIVPADNVEVASQTITQAGNGAVLDQHLQSWSKQKSTLIRDPMGAYLVAD